MESESESESLAWNPSQNPSHLYGIRVRIRVTCMESESESESIRVRIRVRIRITCMESESVSELRRFVRVPACPWPVSRGQRHRQGCLGVFRSPGGCLPGWCGCTCLPAGVARQAQGDKSPRSRSWGGWLGGTRVGWGPAAGTDRGLWGHLISRRVAADGVGAKALMEFGGLRLRGRNAPNGRRDSEKIRTREATGAACSRRCGCNESATLCGLKRPLQRADLGIFSLIRLKRPRVARCSLLHLPALALLAVAATCTTGV